MLESLFTLLFKYRPVVFEDGRFAFETPYPWIFAALALALLSAAVAGYHRRRAYLGRRTSLLLASMRALALTLVLFILLRPAISISTVVPGENFLAVVIDDSRSMQLAADGETTRGTQALATFTAPSSQLAERLRDRFTLRYYRFSDTVSRTDPAHPLDFEGHATHLAAALDHVRQDMSGIPLAGVVLVSDGAANAGTALTDPLLQLASRGIPVYTVGLGEERFDRDVELARVAAPDRLLRGSTFTAGVTLTHHGFGGRTVTLTVEEDGAILATRDVAFVTGQDEVSVTVNLTAEEKGTHRYRFSVDPQDGERVSENNARDVLITVEEREEKILYFEGEPRWEVAFLRRALAGDDNLRLVVLQRSAENKYLRLGIEDPLELSSGFPDTREELFAYRGLVLGSVEADFFTANQLAVIEQFVSQRGGGLLTLGGRRSFAEGGFVGTALEAVFPVVPEPPADESFVAQVKVAPSPAGLGHAALLMGETAELSEQHWLTLPPLSTRNPLYRIKPGATLLLSGTPLEGGDDMVVLASQRYGRGRSTAFAVQDSWLWQMHADMPQADETHERLWRQMLRWLVSAVPGRVQLDTLKNLVAPGEPVELRAEVRDKGYLGLNGARVVATVTDPSGAENVLPMEWTVEEDGDYRAVFVPETLGPYDVRVDAEHASEAVGHDTTRILAEDLPAEFFGAEMNAALLRRVAEETGGRFYTAGNAADLAEDARFTSSGKTVVRSYDLWDMPIVLLLLLGSICSEWWLRRRRGLA